MTTKPIIEIKNLGKRYDITHQRGGYVALRDVLTNVFRNPFSFLKSKAKQVAGLEKKEEFWALKNISFDVMPGEVIGIIGKNGAGKSTLLKILTGITPPTEGEAIMHGRVSSLLEVGTGFHPELTGRENIFLNGAILGMTRKEITRKFDDIVEFSGVSKFLDTPVKRYSSGMQVRLAFSVAAHMEPDILIVDEVLAVGDAEFQKKSMGKMEEVTSRDGRTILFVSHNLAAIQSLCKKTVLLENGQVKMIGPTEEVIASYVGGQRADMRTEWTGNAGNDTVVLTHTWVKSLDQKEVFDTGGPLEIGLEMQIKNPVQNFVAGISLWSEYNYPIALRLCDDTVTGIAQQTIPVGTFTKRFIIPANTLAIGTYYVCFQMGIQGKRLNLGSLSNRTSEGELHFELHNVTGIGRQSNQAIEFGQSSIFRPDWKVL